MKVVLFCGGLGMRLREYSERIPKSMVPLGTRPILWHIMKYYAHYGHREFILCLGHGAEAIKKYFLEYDECVSNDFVLSKGGRQLRLLHRDIEDWTITFADTGLTASIGERLHAVQPYLKGESAFLANYSDGLTDLPLPQHIRQFERWNRSAAFLWVRPNVSFHFIQAGADGTVQEVADVQRSDLRINGGFFVFKSDIFSYLHPGEDLLAEPFQRLAHARQLMANRYDGFWAAMDTFKDKQTLDDMVARGHTPWEVWKEEGNNGNGLGAGSRGAGGLQRGQKSTGRAASGPSVRVP
jgi:glucose-1-phosphate cytidylyltransferase